jgi:dTDP-glucose pyrophosphorylase
MQIMIPLAGKSPFFSSEHYFFPKSLIEVDGTPMIERVISNLAVIAADQQFIFVLPAQDIVRFSMDRTLKLLTDGRCAIVGLQAATKGALCSALMAIDQLDMAAPLIIANGDQVIDADLSRIVDGFRSSNAQAGVVVFDSVHPRWSYVATDDAGRVLQAAEKQAISRNAVAGFYYFETAATFVRAAMRSIETNASYNGHFFIAPCLNEIILEGGLVTTARVASDAYHSFYSPEKINQYEDEVLRDSISGRTGTTTTGPVHLVIPAAGEGSRFREAGYERPKPFIDVRGRPMIDHVIENVAPAGADVHLLLRKEHLTDHEELIDLVRGSVDRIHSVEKLTEGTACTLLLARAAFDDDRPLLVANSDQWVDFDVDDYVRDCIDRDLDGSILVFRDAERNPKWSFARLNDQGLVVEVAEKKPISDLATVGIYLFRRGADFVRGAIDMIARNDRVNNEFYTCPVYNYLIEAGLKIGVYEVPADAMHGLGTPADLDAFLARDVALGTPGSRSAA